MMRVLGIDPGLQLTGYGLVETADNSIEPSLVEAGVIRLNSKQSMQLRLVELYKELEEILRRLKPDVMAVEKLYAHYAHPRTAILMGHARGVILLAASQKEIEIVPLPATEVKKAVTGYGHASKEQMQRAVMSQCNLDELPSPPDVADAIAIALTHGRRAAIEQFTQRA